MIPHFVEQQSAQVALSATARACCWGTALPRRSAIRSMPTASRMSCRTDRGLPKVAAPVKTSEEPAPSSGNVFAGRLRAGPGTRAMPGAATHDSAYAPPAWRLHELSWLDRPGLRTTHPWLQNCIQCHVSPDEIGDAIPLGPHRCHSKKRRSCRPHQLKQSSAVPMTSPAPRSCPMARRFPDVRSGVCHVMTCSHWLRICRPTPRSPAHSARRPRGSKRHRTASHSKPRWNNSSRNVTAIQIRYAYDGHDGPTPCSTHPQAYAPGALPASEFLPGDSQQSEET